MPRSRFSRLGGNIEGQLDIVVVEENDRIKGNIEPIHVTLMGVFDSVVDGNLIVAESNGLFSFLIVDNSTVFGNVETTGRDLVLIQGKTALSGNIISNNDGEVDLINIDVNGNVEVSNVGDCKAANLRVHGNTSGCEIIISKNFHEALPEQEGLEPNVPGTSQTLELGR